MEDRVLKVKGSLITIAIVFVMLVGVFLPASQAKTNIDYVTGFNKGPSNMPVVPIKNLGIFYILYWKNNHI